VLIRLAQSRRVGASKVATKKAKIIVDRGPESALPFGFEIGRMYITTDTHKIYAGQGLTMPLVQLTGNNAGLNFRGPWSSLTNYSPNDLVTFSNTLYIALNASLNEQPDLFPSNWDVVVSGNNTDTDSFVFTQSSPSSTWVIPHNLGLSPAVVVEDSTGTQVFVETHFDNGNQVTLKFGGPESGRATCIG
jgi:hypothetical protein